MTEAAANKRWPDGICGNCRFAAVDMETHYRGMSEPFIRCRRFPPVPDNPSRDRDYPTSSWPRVKSDYWCGEYGSGGDAMRQIAEINDKNWNKK